MTAVALDDLIRSFYEAIELVIRFAQTLAGFFAVEVEGCSDIRQDSETLFCLLPEAREAFVRLADRPPMLPKNFVIPLHRHFVPGLHIQVELYGLSGIPA